MKKITLFLLLSIGFLANVNAQCTSTTGGQWPTSVITVLNNGAAETISSNNWPNAEISLLEGLVVGNTYTVTGTNSSSIYITVAETPSDFSTIGTTITHGASTVSFTATTPEILIFWHLDALCGTQSNIDTLTTIQCTSASCTCTASAAPDAVSAVAPANGATNIPINYGTTNNVGPFEWSETLFGEPADSFNISLGTNIAGDDIGSIQGFDSGNSINFAWQPNTTYFWFIESINCVGTTSSAVFSFTTDACTDTAVPAAATAPTPTDGATNVTINADDNGLAFVWTGDPGASFTLNLGTANPPTQAFDNFESGDRIIGLAENTTYFWSIDPTNCFGVTSGTVWSFTTGLALSVQEVQLEETFSIYPNPVDDILNIKSANSIDNVIIFDLLGKEVANYDENNIVRSTVDMSDLPEGLYLVKITSGEKTQTFKVTKD